MGSAKTKGRARNNTVHDIIMYVVVVDYALEMQIMSFDQSFVYFKKNTCSRLLVP
jgi:hypothetical protein